MKQPWSFALVRLAGALATAVGLGLVFGAMQWWLVGVLALYLSLQLVALYRVQRWLRHRSYEMPPDLGGVWGDVVALIGRIHRRKQFHKRRAFELLFDTEDQKEGMAAFVEKRAGVWTGK